MEKLSIEEKRKVATAWFRAEALRRGESVASAAKIEAAHKPSEEVSMEDFMAAVEEGLPLDDPEGFVTKGSAFASRSSRFLRGLVVFIGDDGAVVDKRLNPEA